MLPLALALTVALVTQDQTPLRALAHDNAPRQTALTSGDWLEVRGEAQGYLKVYDHRRERPGYVRPGQVHVYEAVEGSAPALGAVVDYLRDAPGQESLGIGYVALYLRVARPEAVGPSVFDSLGTMAERLGRRASVRVAQPGDASLAAEIEVAESYGVHFASVTREGMTQICYDGEAFRRVLALGGTGMARARAALALTDPRCLDPSLGATPALAVTKWQSEVLASVDPALLDVEVPASTRARLRLRRSIVSSELAFFAARVGDVAAAKDAAETSKHELALADRALLADEDRAAYEEAALRASTVRWAGEPTPTKVPGSGISVEIVAGEPGQTCVRLKTIGAQPFEHCTYGVVWPSSVRIAPHDAAVALVVVPMEGWSELLVLHPGANGWIADTLAPAALDPDVGYVEVAGFSADGQHLLAVREARASGPLGSPHTLAPWIRKVYQTVTLADLHVEKEVTVLANLPPAKRWDTADWKRGTLALR